MTNLELKIQAKNIGMASFHIDAFSASLDVIRCAKLATLSRYQQGIAEKMIMELEEISGQLGDFDEQLQNIARTLDEQGITKEV